MSQAEGRSRGKGSGRGRRRRGQRAHGAEGGHNIKLSKSLSYLLRHGAAKMGFQLDPGGFLYVDEVLKHPQFKRYTADDVRQVVADNDKKRFALQEEEGTGRLQIRANQGHTLEVEELDLTPITDPAEAPTVVHGTFLSCWDKIRTQGLSRMRRNHIHFAPGEPGEDGVISGMRRTCQVLVFIDMEAAMRDGLQFFRSANNVILSPGNEEGLIPPKYFQQVLQARPRRVLPLDLPSS
ncbi:tRNA 2'-phosphotransferase 1-like isoform X1 [Branchiostoma floridae]|uniref:2'-phosphotransferase n=1 Tax=Branchiostoma floridae TaxID=7739 RepID=A0A9J7NAA6_BRAFL|nr:tRNA 2'-phosphotransferase 1-like isoform X1 [Branchiostoma floridae]